MYHPFVVVYTFVYLKGSRLRLNTGTITLIIYIVVLMPLMLLGFYFARRKMFDPHHKLTMTLIVILNWVLISVVMITSYIPIATDLPDSLNQSSALMATIHGIVGLIAQLMASYLVLLMWTENSALERLIIFRIRNIKTPMRITLALWLITVCLGFGVYGFWYGNPATANDAPPPVTTEDVDTPETAPAPDTTEQVVPVPATTEDAGLADDMTDDAEDLADDMTDVAEDLANDMTDTAEDLADDMTDAAEDAEDND